jgi:3-isopropylmalate dehydrogenase
MTDKSNVMRFGHDLWQRVFFELAGEYPEVDASHMFVDALCMQLVKAPEQFEVIVANNMLGDILTDLGAGLQGGLGVAASANLHPGRVSMFEPVHGSAPKYAGTGRANPLGAVLSSALMLAELGHEEAAAEIERVAASAIRDGRVTPDLGGTLKTSEVGDAIAREIAAATLAR